MHRSKPRSIRWWITTSSFGAASKSIGRRTSTRRSKPEVTDLLKQIVRKNYRKNLNRTLNYNITYTGQHAQGSDMLVRTQAQSKVNARDPVVQIDYVVEGSPNGPYHVVDIVAENSSTVTNYYRQFHTMLTTPSQGYPYLVEKLKAKIKSLDAQP